MIFPEINLNGLINPVLSFYFLSIDEDMDGSGESTGNVLFNIDVFDGNTWHNNHYSSSRDSVAEFGWEKVIIELDPFSNQIIKIRFRVDEVSTYYKDDFAIDDVIVAEKIDCDNVDLGQVSVELQSSTNSIKASWYDQFNLSSLTWKVEIVENGDQPSGIGIDVDENEYIFTNLSENTYYDVYYKFDCDNSNWDMITIRTALLNEMNNSYRVNRVPNKYYNSVPVALSIADDVYSSILNLSFDFNYFGNSYNQLVVGNNGVISFDIDKANQFCPYEILSENFLPNVNNFDNSILGVHQDFNILSANNCNFQTVGFYPFRKFIISYLDAPLYGCSSSFSSTNQVLFYETYNFIDVQIIEKTYCSFNNGNGILGIKGLDPNVAYFPPNRNTGNWEAHDEGWRFRPVQNHPDYQYIICDANVDGVEVFDLNTIYTHFGNSTTNTYTAFETLADAENNSNGISTTNYTNLTNAQTIFIRELTATGDISIKRVLLAAIDCTADYDLDTIATADEDLNNNGNYGDDDTDGDQIPDFIDEDDDGDYVLTSVEAIITTSRNTNSTTNYIDTDGDQIPNYLDNEDDGDGILSLDEDLNSNYNLLDDDTDGDNIPDYLDNEALSVEDQHLNLFSLHPNPVKEILIINFNNMQSNVDVKIYTIQGQKIYSKNNNSSTVSIDVSNFSSGVYFVNILNDRQIYTKKFIKE